jgi:aminoglycoside phosphotransferase family enzyme
MRVTAEMTQRLREQAAQLQEAENKRRELGQKLEEEKKSAEDKAREMLFDLIGADKREEYERTGQVYVQGQRHGYIVRGHGHVKRIEGNGKIRELCIHLQDHYRYPDTDNVIALLMSLKYDEENFIKTANKHGLFDISHYQRQQLEAAGMPKDALRTKIILPAKAPTLGEGIAA